MILNPSCGERLLTANIILNLISSVVLIEMPPPFEKGVLWAAKTAKMSFRWKYGNGKIIRFWEDQWFGTCSLAVQFWEIYTIVHEHGISLREAWDGVNLRLTFRRTVDDR
jgi:hypothetical protein